MADRFNNEKPHSRQLEAYLKDIAMEETATGTDRPTEDIAISLVQRLRRGWGGIPRRRPCPNLMTIETRTHQGVTGLPQIVISERSVSKSQVKPIR